MVAAKALGTGDTVLVFASEGGGPTTGKDLVAYGVVHYGAGSEAGAGAALVKVACARDAESFQRLLVACENLAGAVPGVKVLVAGVNTGRGGAFEAAPHHEEVELGVGHAPDRRPDKVALVGKHLAR